MQNGLALRGIEVGEEVFVGHDAHASTLASSDHDNAVVVAVEHRARLERNPAELDRNIDLPRSRLSARSRVVPSA